MAGESSNIGTQVTLPSGALLTLASDGSFSYDPNDAFEATTEDSFTYMIENWCRHHHHRHNNSQCPRSSRDYPQHLRPRQRPE